MNGKRLRDRGEPIAYEPGNNIRIPWLVILGLLFTLLGSGFAYLEQKKADRMELTDHKESINVFLVEMRRDIRDIRNVLIGPAVRPNR